MDFIIKKFNSKLLLQDPASSTYVNMLRQRVEYMLFFSLAYLWEKKAASLDPKTLSRIIENLNRINIGTLVGTLRTLDEQNEIFVNKKVMNDLNNYPNFRNDNHGHGYVVDEKVYEQTSELERLYSVFSSSIPLFQQAVDLILVTKKENDTVSGIRFPVEQYGSPEPWSCKEEVFGCVEPYIGRTFAYLETGKYIKISPFISLENMGEEGYLFVSLEEKLTGKIQYAKLFRTEKVTREWKEISDIFIQENEYRRISPNGSIMNDFENNYKEYIETKLPVEKTLREFLLKDKSSVCCTVWGHGGVGKTAIIQNIATTLFNQQKKVFDYIVFASAKDRKYNPITGKIEITDERVDSFEDVMFTICSTLYDLKCEYDEFVKQIDHYIQAVINHESKNLIIMDDFETFKDSEKKKLNDFIQKLNINHHKVIITTRVKRGAIGREVTTSELDKATSIDFLRKIIVAEYPAQLARFEGVISDGAKVETIYKATAGRPIFLYQFAHLFVQFGLREKDLKQLADSPEAKAFLYDRLYDYLGEREKNIFVYISQIINEEDSSFNETVLAYFVKELENRHDISAELEELANMLIIVSNSSKIHRVYSNEIERIMKEYFERRDETFRRKFMKIKERAGEIDFSKDIYPSLLEKADKSRRFESDETIIELYGTVLDASESSLEIKKKAIKNVTGYFTTTIPSTAIEIYRKYFRYFKDDQEIVRLYARLLWGEGERAKAISILQNYYADRKKTESESLVLFFLLTEYQGKYFLRERRAAINEADGNEEKIEEARLTHKPRLMQFFNEFGWVAYQPIKQLSREDLDDNGLLENHLTNALMEIVKVGTELILLDDEVNNRLEIVLGLIEYGIKNLKNRSHKLLKSCLDTIENHKGKTESQMLQDVTETKFERFNRSYKLGDVVDFEVTGTKPYGVFVSIENVSGLIHESNLPLPYRKKLPATFKIGTLIRAEIVSIDNINERFGARFVSFQPEQGDEKIGVPEVERTTPEIIQQPAPLPEIRESKFERFTRLYQSGDKAEFQITGTKPFGVFGKVDDIAGLLHVSNIPAVHQKSLADTFQNGMVIHVKIDQVDSVKKRFVAQFVSF